MLIRQRECHSYYRDVHYYVNTSLCPAFLLATMPLDATKRWTCSFFVVVESKPNRNCNSRLTIECQLQHQELVQRQWRTLPRTIHPWATDFLPLQQPLLQVLQVLIRTCCSTGHLTRLLHQPSLVSRVISWNIPLLVTGFCSSRIDENQTDIRRCLLNARSLCNKLADLYCLLYTDRIAILFVTESWLHSGIPAGLLDPRGQYSIIQRDRPTHRGGGVCVMIAKTILYYEIRCDNSVELVAVDVLYGIDLVWLRNCWFASAQL